MIQLKKILSGNVGAFSITPDMPLVDDGRCDAGKRGPLGFHQWDGEHCTCGATEPPDPIIGFHGDVKKITAHHTIIDLPGIGSLSWFNTSADLTDLFERTNLTAAATLPGAFRIMLEWAWAADNGNTQQIAIVMRAMRDELSMPDELVFEVLGNPPEMVGRFLARKPKATNYDVRPSPDLLAWVGSKT